MTCGVSGGSDAERKKIADRCVFLPVFVWPRGTQFFGGKEEPWKWQPPPPLPNNLPTIWDITAKPLPPSPSGYFWIRGSEFPCWWMTCRLGMGCIHPSPRTTYPVTTYVLKPYSDVCRPEAAGYEQNLGLLDEVPAELR